jgi:hypothetical protein
VNESLEVEFVIFVIFLYLLKNLIKELVEIIKESLDL